MGISNIKRTPEEELELKASLYKEYCEAAKSYVQIACAALAVPIVFSEAFFGRTALDAGLRTVGVPWQLISSWVCFLLTIFFGLMYQWLAVRRLWDTAFNTKSCFQKLNREWVFGPMLACFWVGALLFVLFAGAQLSK